MTPSQEAPCGPWDIDVADCRKTGLTLDQARDRTALAWLQAGDTRALAVFLLDGYVPDPAVLKAIGWILLGEDNYKNFPATLSERYPYQLTLKRRSGKKGRPQNQETKTRDRLLARNMRALINMHGLTYEQAIDRMTEAASETGASLGEKTIRNAYDAKHGKKTRV